MVDAFTFTDAVVRDEISGDDLNEIEKVCIGQLGKEKLANTRMGESNNRLSVTHDGYSSLFVNS
jgi:hypothetical protein